jgi:hypothetical protein
MREVLEVPLSHFLLYAFTMFMLGTWFGWALAH